jgi:predicted O-linked N-acetylglucosamine transferase (SPINDLY family)
MRLLHKVENSVLWLRATTIPAMSNLRREAEQRGIAADRLIFASLASIAEHITRHQAADLFLDTFTYNAHTTASDALWAGLPVVTLLGETFPSRVTASLLTAVDMPELITHTIADYENLALDLATNHEKRARLRQHLVAVRKTTALFDTVRFAYHLELAYRKMVEIHDRGGMPEHFEIADAYEA